MIGASAGGRYRWWWVLMWPTALGTPSRRRIGPSTTTSPAPAVVVVAGDDHHLPALAGEAQQGSIDQPLGLGGAVGVPAARRGEHPHRREAVRREVQQVVAVHVLGLEEAVGMVEEQQVLALDVEDQGLGVGRLGPEHAVGDEEDVGVEADPSWRARTWVTTP